MVSQFVGKRLEKKPPGSWLFECDVCQKEENDLESEEAEAMVSNCFGNTRLVDFQQLKETIDSNYSCKSCCDNCLDTLKDSLVSLV